MNKQDIDFIKQEHKKYQKIFNVDLPDFDEITFDNIDQFVSYNFEKEKHYLYLCNQCTNFNELYFRAILYREFTKQAMKYRNPFCEDELNIHSYKTVYSDIYGASIELRTLISKTEEKIININELIETHKGYISCEAYILSKIVNLDFSFLMNSELNEKCIYKTFYNEIKKVFQYIGYIDVLDNKHFENFKAQLLLKTNDITLSKIFSDIINFYKEKDIINLMLACAINSYTYPKIIYNQNTQ